MTYTVPLDENTGDMVVLPKAAFRAMQAEARELTDKVVCAEADLQLMAERLRQVTAERDELLERAAAAKALWRSIPPPPTGDS